MDDLLAATSRVEAEHFWFRGFRRFVDPLLATAAAGRSDLRTLDCGCGTGYNLLRMSPYGRAFGFDLTSSGLAMARRAGRPLVRADITCIPFQASTFDLLTSFDVLQAVDDDRAAMGEVSRVLKSGGVAILTAAALDSLKGGHAAKWPEARRYTRASLRALTEGAGLRVERVAYLFGSLFPLLLAVRTLQRQFNRDAAGDDWEMAVPAAPVNAMLGGLLRAEAAVTRYVPLAPAGSSVLVVARKP